MLLVEKVPPEQNLHGTLGSSNTESNYSCLSTSRQLQLGPLGPGLVGRRSLPEPSEVEMPFLGTSPAFVGKLRPVFRPGKVSGPPALSEAPVSQAKTLVAIGNA